MYSELYKAWKSEKGSLSPEPLSKDFYQRVASYLKALEEDSLSTDSQSIQAVLTTREKEIANRLLNELRETRLRKVLESAKNGTSISRDQLTEEEQALVKTIDTSLMELRTPQDRKTEAPPSEQIDIAVVRFLQDIPEIVGVDLKIYGPYKKEDVGSLPNQNAQALVRQGAAKVVEVRGMPDSKSEKLAHQQ
jgi:DNA replication factor GINS